MEYRYPHEIDAHLSDAVLDGVPVEITQGIEKIPGRFSFSDDFGLVTFVPQGAWQPQPDAEIRAVYTHGGRLCAFVSRVVDQVGRSRWHLRRPRQIISTLRSIG